MEKEEEPRRNTDEEEVRKIDNPEITSILSRGRKQVCLISCILFVLEQILGIPVLWDSV